MRRVTLNWEHLKYHLEAIGPGIYTEVELPAWEWYQGCHSRQWRMGTVEDVGGSQTRWNVHSATVSSATGWHDEGQSHQAQEAESCSCFKSSIVHDCCRVSRYTLSIPCQGYRRPLFAVEENMRAWASFHRFTICFPRKASWWFGGFLVSCFALFWWFSFCLRCFCCLGLHQQAHLVTRPLSLPMTLVRICKDCHYRHDERSNSPKKKTDSGRFSVFDILDPEDN